MNQPLVSVCVPTFNGEKYLAEALFSIQEQTYKNLEVIISDDASNDKTIQISENFKKKCQFPVRIYHHKPSVIGANWNFSIKKAKGDYIKFLFQDDILFATCIQELMIVIQGKKDIGLVACKRKILFQEESEENKLWSEKYEDLQANLNLKDKKVYYLTKDLFSHVEFLKTPRNKIGEPSAVLFKKEIIREIGGFRKDLKQNLDYEFYYRILVNKKIAILNEKLICFRLHNEQATYFNKATYCEDFQLYEKIIYEKYFQFLNEKDKQLLNKKFSSYKKYLTKILNVIKNGF